MNENSEKKAPRPFYFVMVVWGERYRNYFLEYCLPSLLAPGNIPSIAGHRPAKYLVATTPVDWAAMQATAIFSTLKRYIEPVYVELPPCPPERPYWLQNIFGHKLCCDIIFRDKAYRLFTSPDSVFSDGSVARMHELALRGSEVILKLTVPQADEAKAFRTLRKLDMLPDVSSRDSGEPLVFTGRELSRALMQSMHDMSIVNEWDAPYFAGYASTPWWRVRGNDGSDGLVAFGFLWDVMLIDYGAVKTHDPEVLNDRGWDGDYIISIVGDLQRFYFVRDSDELNLLGWAHLPGPPVRRHPYGTLGKGIAFRNSYNRPTLNRLQRSFFFIPTRIHSGPTDASWDAVEAQGLRTILTWTDPPADIARLSRGLPVDLQAPNLDDQIRQIEFPWWRRYSAPWRLFLIVASPVVLCLIQAPAALKCKANAATAHLFSICVRCVRFVLGKSGVRRWLERHVRRVLRI
jgi:hypothetical protein